MVLRVLPVELDWFCVRFELPGEGMDRPFRLELLVDQGEWFAAPEESDVAIIQGSFF